MPSSTLRNSWAETSSMRSTSRSFETARIWSMTATAVRPAQDTGTSSGGLGLGEVESGITTTVRRRSFTMLVVRTRQGRVLRISDPSVGSSRTHHSSPRRGVIPRLYHFGADGVHFTLERRYVCVRIGGITGTQEFLITVGKATAESFRDIAGAVPGRHLTEEANGNFFGQRKGHLARGHRAIMPYIRRSRQLIKVKCR